MAGEYQFKDCYDIDELDKLGIKVRLGGEVFDVSFIYEDSELNQDITLAWLGNITFGDIRFASSFTFVKSFRTLFQDKFKILPVFKPVREWSWPEPGKAVKLHATTLTFGMFNVPCNIFRDALYRRLVETIELYKKKKESLKWKYNLYRKYVFNKTPAKKFFRYGPVSPEITVLPNGNEVTVKKFNDKYYIAKVFNPVIIGTGPKGDIYDTEITYFIIEHDFRKNRNRILVELSQEKFDMLKEI